VARSRIVNVSNLQQFTAINVLSDPGVIGGPIVIPNAMRIMLVWTLTNAKTARNILYGQITGAVTPGTALADSIFSALKGHSSFAPLMTFIIPTCSFARVEVQDVRQADLPVFASTGAAAPGTSTGSAVPDEAALVLTLRTNKIGPGNRGRLYQPGWGTNAIGAGGVVAAGAVTALGNWGGGIATAIGANGMSWALGQPARAAYTSATGTSHPARPAGVLPFTTFLVRDNHWDSQRRRGLK